MTTVIRYRRNIVEHFPQTGLQKPTVGVFLNFDQIWNLEDLFLTGKRHAGSGSTFYRTNSIFLHELYTPSLSQKACQPALHPIIAQTP